MSAEERKQIVEQAVTNEKLEGLKVSFATRKVMEEYIYLVSLLPNGLPIRYINATEWRSVGFC